MIGAWREKSLGPVWSPTVVMGAVLGKYGPQVPEGCNLAIAATIESRRPYKTTHPDTVPRCEGVELRQERHESRAAAAAALMRIGLGRHGCAAQS